MYANKISLVPLSGSVTCTLSRNGDLVQEIYLNTTVTASAGSANAVPAGVKLTDLTNLIKTVEVEIGGQKIDKHYSAWLDIYNELFETIMIIKNGSVVHGRC